MCWIPTVSSRFEIKGSSGVIARFSDSAYFASDGGGDPFCSIYDFDNRRRLQDGGEDCDPNVLETARQNPDLSTVVMLIEAADLADIFDCAGPFTALLPNNAAFDNLDPDYVAFLLRPENQNELQDLLLYHILPRATMTTEFSAGATETLLQGQRVDVGVSPIMFDDSSVVTADIPACNGFIDIIDEVLMPFPPREL